jgi:CheY-like chemotaxis protein
VAARILIVEDHPASLEMMDYLLRAMGYETLLAKDGPSALEIAAREHLDLVVCDLQLPQMTGYEIAEHFKSDPRLRHIPLIAVTAFSMAGDKEKVLSSSFEGYYAKPIDPEHFVFEMEQHLEPALRARSRGEGNSWP